MTPWWIRPLRRFASPGHSFLDGGRGSVVVDHVVAPSRFESCRDAVEIGGPSEPGERGSETQTHLARVVSRRRAALQDPFPDLDGFRVAARLKRGRRDAISRAGSRDGQPVGVERRRESRVAVIPRVLDELPRPAAEEELERTAALGVEGAEVLVHLLPPLAREPVFRRQQPVRRILEVVGDGAERERPLALRDEAPELLPRLAVGLVDEGHGKRARLRQVALVRRLRRCDAGEERDHCQADGPGRPYPEPHHPVF